MSHRQAATSAFSGYRLCRRVSWIALVLLGLVLLAEWGRIKGAGTAYEKKQQAYAALHHGARNPALQPHVQLAGGHGTVLLMMILGVIAVAAFAAARLLAGQFHTSMDLAAAAHDASQTFTRDMPSRTLDAAGRLYERVDQAKKKKRLPGPVVLVVMREITVTLMRQLAAIRVRLPAGLAAESLFLTVRVRPRDITHFLPPSPVVPVPCRAAARHQARSRTGLSAAASHDPQTDDSLANPPSPG